MLSDENSQTVRTEIHWRLLLQLGLHLPLSGKKRSAIWTTFLFLPWVELKQPGQKWGNSWTHFPSFQPLLSGLKPRPVTPISECGMLADRPVNIHEKATSLMISAFTERHRGHRRWPHTGHREPLRDLDYFQQAIVKVTRVPYSYLKGFF